MSAEKKSIIVRTVFPVNHAAMRDVQCASEENQISSLRGKIPKRGVAINKAAVNILCK